MRKYILFFAFQLMLLPFLTSAQILYPTGTVYDSTTFTFSTQDSLVHYLHGNFFSPDSTITIDTASATLWQIGNTLKPFFSNGTITARAIMTDTLHPYPKNANDFFVLKIDFIPNFIVDFWHKYETDSLHAGGIVEYSTDSGVTWVNIANCNFINTENFYAQTDTVVSGQPAFTGTSNGEQLSRLQFINCIGAKQTTTSCTPFFGDNQISMYLRFRFVSDTTTDTLSGWIIDSIKIENPGCIPGLVPVVGKQSSINISPNPATTMLTITSSDKISTIAITNLVGQTVYSHTYSASEVQVDVADLPGGVYFVRINNYAVRKFVKE